MTKTALQFAIEQLGDEAVAFTGCDQRAFAIEFSRRFDQRFPAAHPDRSAALKLAVRAGYVERTV